MYQAIFLVPMDCGVLQMDNFRAHITVRILYRQTDGQTDRWTSSNFWHTHVLVVVDDKANVKLCFCTQEQCTNQTVPQPMVQTCLLT